jgi:predicted nuclease with TOPRIM domain
MSSDADVQEQIDRLEAERERLFSREGERDPTQEQDRVRLEEIRVELDRLFDLKRQRAALRAAGSDPDQATERSADTVEHYRQ